MSSHLKAHIWGAVFGLFAPIVGLFIGLQISPIVADILMWPVLLLARIVGTPFGSWGWGLISTGLIVSILLWSMVFALVQRLLALSK